MRSPVWVLASVVLAACAASPPEAPVSGSSSHDKLTAGNSTHRANSSQYIRWRVDSELPIIKKTRDDKDALVASNVSVGLHDLLHYQVSYSLQPGDVLASAEPETADRALPTQFATQQLGQNVRLRLPEFAGAPLSLGFTTEFNNSWLVSGGTRSQREQANLNWAPGPAIVTVKWVGSAAAFDPSLALECDLQSTIKLPTSGRGSAHSEALQLSGRVCRVAGGDGRYAGVEAQTWGVGYVWNRPERQSEAILTVIDPVWAGGADVRDFDPSYELGLSHRRDFGAWSAKALLSVRHATILDVAAPLDIAGGLAGTVDTNLAANAALTWRLPEASLSATWAEGVDRLWFLPDESSQSDRLGVALDLSRWVATMLPDASPQLAMNWNWSELRLPGNTPQNNNSLSLTMALMF